jgi:hypothetical protein
LNELLILIENVLGQSEVGLLSLSNGNVEHIPYDPPSIDNNHMFEHLRGWDRVYGDRNLYVRSQEKRTCLGLWQPRECQQL